MTDKEQIEEMAKVILQGTDKYCALVLGSKEDKPIILYEKFLAEALYEAGYRKVGENEVVISKDELVRKETNYKIGLGKSQSWVKKLKDETERLQHENYVIEEKVRKETAKEILSLLLSDEYICYFDVAVVKEIAQKYGVEIKK